MRFVGYLILLVLALYFILLKPYLLAKRVYWEMEGLSASFERGFGFKSFLLYLPLKDATLYLFLREVSLKPWQFYVKEFSLIEASRAVSEEPFDYDFTNLTRLASRINLKVESLYISTNYLPYGESLTLFIPQTEIRAGRVFSQGWTRVYWMHFQEVHSLEVYLQSAHVVGSKFFIDKAEVKSPLYSFELKGFWEGKKGGFWAWGRIEPVEGESFYVGEVNLNLKGDVEYTRLRVGFWGNAERLLVKGRRDYRDLKIEGEYLWRWRKENVVKGKLWKDKTILSFDYSIKDKVFEGSFVGFPLDGRLLGTEKNVSSVISGSIKVNLEKKRLILQAYTPLLEVDQHRLSNCTLKLDLDYSHTSRGSFDFVALQPFYLSLKGSFSKGTLVGDVSLVDYPLKMEGLSSTLSYKGPIYLRNGRLSTEGDGRLSNLLYKDISLGPASYHFKLDGDNYTLDLRGETLSLHGGGSLEEKSFSGEVSFMDMNLSYKDLFVKSLKGRMDVSISKDFMSFSGSLWAFLSREKLSSFVALNFDLTKKEDKLLGYFKGSLKEAKAFDFVYEKGEFSGRVQGEKLFLSFDLEQRLKGEGQYSLRDGSYGFVGSIKEVFKGVAVKGNYSLKGVGEDFEFAFSGDGKYKDFSFPIRGKLSLKEEVLNASLEGFTTKNGLVSLKAEGLKLHGSRERGSLEVKPVMLMVGQEVLSKVDFERGIYKGKSLRLKGRLSGVVEGDIDIDYSETLDLSSKGAIDLTRLFPLVKSRILADGEGKVLYSLSYKGGKVSLLAESHRLLLRSRYAALPLEGELRVSLREDRLSGSLKLRGDQRAFVLANFTGDNKLVKVDFELTNLPILLREQNIRASLLLSGKGSLNSDYKSLNIGGKFYTSGFINLQKLEAKRASPQEWYKRINFDISVASSEPLRINLPEGFIYADLSAALRGTLYEPDYKLSAYFKGGNLSYFGRSFYVRRGEAIFTNKENYLDLTVITPTPDYSIIIDIKGNPQYPKALVRSEPPRDVREVLTTLVLGSKEGEGLIPVADALISQLPQVSQLVRGAKGITGLDIKLQVSPSVSPTGEVGISATVSKDITERMSVEHRQSTLRNPKETYTGGEVKLTPSTSIGGKIYSDRSQEYRFRIRKKFDF